MTYTQAGHPSVHDVDRCVLKIQPLGDVGDLEKNVVGRVARLDRDYGEGR
jgi:hypothetical protein